jgi:hypothetical protein
LGGGLLGEQWQAAYFKPSTTALEPVLSWATEKNQILTLNEEVAGRIEPKVAMPNGRSRERVCARNRLEERESQASVSPPIL